MNKAVDLPGVLMSFQETWSPRAVATLNDYDTRVVKIESEFTRHNETPMVSSVPPCSNMLRRPRLQLPVHWRAGRSSMAERSASARSAAVSSTMLVVRAVVVVAPVVAAVLAVLIAVPPRAGAASHGLQSTVLWQTSADGTDYVLREITIAPGGSTGWHWHDGRLYGVIKQGALTHNMSDSSIDGIYQTGDSIAEPSGADHVHIGRNLGSTPLVMQVLYINPAGSPLSEDAPDPGCS
jgi:quercetin dioxygenase-like cupin family protein